MYSEATMGQNKSREDPMSREIDDKIRDLYNQTLQEDVPDRFAKLLEELRKKEDGK